MTAPLDFARAVRPTGRHRKSCQLHRCGLGPSGAGRPIVGTAELDRPMVPPPAVAAGMPPVPLGNMTGQGFGPAVLQYGFRPSFVARPPAAG
jgi:hypothetical protein